MIPIEEEIELSSFSRMEYPRTKKHMSHLGELTQTQTKGKFKIKKSITSSHFRKPKSDTPSQLGRPNERLNSNLDYQQIKNKIKENLMIAHMVSARDKEQQKRAITWQQSPLQAPQKKIPQVKLTPAEQNLKRFLCQKLQRGDNISQTDQQFLRQVCEQQLITLLSQREARNKSTALQLGTREKLSWGMGEPGERGDGWRLGEKKGYKEYLQQFQEQGV